MAIFWIKLATALLFLVLGLGPWAVVAGDSAAGPALVARQGSVPGMPVGPGPPDITSGPPGIPEVPDPTRGSDPCSDDGDDTPTGPGDTAAADAARAAVMGACDASTFIAILPANASVEKIVHVAAGGSYGDGAIDLNYPTNPTNLPALCAVTIYVITSNSSAYRFGLFLPTGDESGSTPWNGRFLAVGNGGFGGGINWLDMGAGVQYGFAVVSTDTGHNSTSADLRWALNEPEQREDWGWRALHGSVALGKQLTTAFYNTSSAYSYYSGCSTGGRQGLKEVQIDPTAFNGVLVGASAWDVNHLNPWVTKVGTYNLPLNASYHLDVAQFPSMAAEVIRQCDALDGVQDGIVSAPRNCTPDYTTLACGGAGTNNTVGGLGSGGADNSAADGLLCLNKGQMATAAAAYADYMSSPTDGSAPTLLYPGLDPGCEAQWYAVLSQPETSPYGIGYIRNFVYNDANWSWTEYNDAVIIDAERTDPGHPTADNYDLSQFRDRGGRLVMYHGLADGLVPPRGSELFYTRVAQNMTTDGSTIGLTDWFRYFEVPGMQHCLSTAVNAPWYVVLPIS
jgi:feruloyl esterase